MSVFSLFTNKEELFWRWFQKNENMILNFDTDREHVFDRLNYELGKVNNGLTFEFGSIKNDGTKEFIISADGIRSVFPAVERLFNRKPKLARWKIIKFRPRRYPICNMTINNVTIKADEVNYIFFEDQNPDKVGIMLFFEEYYKDEKDTMGQAGYLLLDEALGEYDVETKVGAIVFETKDSEYYGQSLPLMNMAEDFDKQFSTE